jgi:hypothetical protein
MHLRPYFLGRENNWLAAAEDVRPPLVDAARSFAVLGFDGRTRGAFVSSPARSATSRFRVGGDYDGRGWCSRAWNDEEGSHKAHDWGCIDAGGCGLAVAVIDDESTTMSESPDLVVVGTCIVEERLIVDIDGDDEYEAFALSAFVEGRSFAGEVIGAPTTKPTCERRFTTYGSRFIGAGHGETLPVSLRFDILGTGDFDDDGALEIAVAIRSGDSKIVALYSAEHQAMRLERLAMTSSE